MAIVAILFVTAGEILYKPTAAAQVLDAAPEHLVGQYQGLYAGACTSGTLLAGPVGAAVYAAAPALLWPFNAAVALVAAGLMLALSRTTARVTRPPGPKPAELSTPRPAVCG